MKGAGGQLALWLAGRRCAGCAPYGGTADAGRRAGFSPPGRPGVARQGGGLKPALRVPSVGVGRRRVVVLGGAGVHPPSTGSGGPARGAGQREAIRLTDNIWQASGFGNTFLITTPEGNVIIDTSSAAPAQDHVKLLKAKSAAPVKYIILTHAHGDHTGGDHGPEWIEHRDYEYGCE